MTAKQQAFKNWMKQKMTSFVNLFKSKKTKNVEVYIDKNDSFSNFSSSDSDTCDCGCSNRRQNFTIYSDEETDSDSFPVTEL